jgi:hypothetical protein
MNDHRNDGSDLDRVAREASDGLSALESWLATDAAVVTFGPEAAKRHAYSICADAIEVALDTSGLSQDATYHLLGDYRVACSRAGREPLEHLMALGRSPEDDERLAWVQAHADEAREPGGILTWEQIPCMLRLTLLHEGRIVPVDELRERARRGGLQTIKGVGPAREQQLLEALDEDPAT